MRLSLLLAFLFTSTVALAADIQINQISVEQSDSDTIIRLFGSDLIRSPKDRVFFAAEASSYSVEPTMMYGDSEYVEVALGMPVMAGQYRISIGPNENTSTLESMVIIGAIGPQGPAGRDGADGVDGSQGEPGLPGEDGSSCSVSATLSGALISCTNGTIASIFNGVNGINGVNGSDGSSCTVSQTADGAEISCSDGSQAIVSNGEDGQNAPNLTAELQAVLASLAALEARVSDLEPEPVILPLDLDGDGLPNNADFDAADLSRLFLSTRSTSLQGDVLSVSGGASIKNERLWEFELPAGLNLDNYAELSVTIAIEMEKPNGADSDFAIGISDERKVMVFVNNDSRNTFSRAFDGNVFVQNGVTYHDENNSFFTQIAGTERDNYETEFNLTRTETTINIRDLTSVYPDQTANFPVQLLEAERDYKIVVHANEVPEQYRIKRILISFPDHLVDPE